MFSVLTAFILKCAVIVAAQNNMFPGRVHESMCVGMMDGIVFPDPARCDTFMQCQRGVVMGRRCESGTFFDLGLYYCVPSHTVDCGSRQQPTSNTPPSSPNSPEVPTSESHHSVSGIFKEMWSGSV